MDRGTWWSVVHGVAKSQTRLKRLSTHMQVSMKWCVTVIFTCISQIASEVDHIFIGFLAIWAYFFFGEMLVLVLFHFSFSLVFHLLICRGSLL